MLRNLSVRNLAVLAGGEIELDAGFNVLTGETGAGKSLLVDSLALLAGGRAAGDLVRDGAETLTVAGVFDLDRGLAEALGDAGFEVDESELIVRREVSREGRNRVFVNDRPATARLLQELAPRLLRIHGQREELGLAEPALQRAWLDRVGGEEGETLLARVAAAFHEHRRLAERLESLSGDERLRAERVELLAFQARELEEAAPTAGEDDELRREREALRHHEAIAAGLGEAAERVAGDEGSALALVHGARRALAAIADWEPLARELEGELGEAEIRLSEAGRSLTRKLGGLETDPRRLDEVEARLALLERLCRKYGLDAAGLAERRSEIVRELAELESGETDRDALAERVAAALADYRRVATELSQARAAWARTLEERVAGELAELALGKAKLVVSLERERRQASPLVVGEEPVEFGAEGFDRVVFGFAPNPGEPLLPLIRIASGGELARVALALQLATRGDEVAGEPTLVFDEIDAGLGGAEGAAIGRKLRRLARRGQVLAVTHLPQVACFGDRHYRVSKRERSGRTHAEVAPLDRAGRVEEVARMLSADRITPASRRHAEELLTGAAKARR